MLVVGEKKTTLRCNYANREITQEVRLHRNIYNYYKLNVKKRGLVESGDYSKFVYSNRQDKTISQLASDIKETGKKHGLNDDQTLELATCFVQNIPYDDNRYSKIAVSGNKSFSEQFPYETLFNNSGICTDKTYLASLLLRELGYGTGIFIFPSAHHMTLAVKTPSGYTDFSSKYSIIDVTSPGFAPGQIPSDIDKDNGRSSATIKKVSDLNVNDDPSKTLIDESKTIGSPTLVIDVNDGAEYSRIIPVKNLEKKILGELQNITAQQKILVLSYNELKRRDSIQSSAYNSYLLTTSTKLDCGYKYNYSYSYFSYSYYSSPYTYRCDTVTNPDKSYKYSSYLTALSSYNNQVKYHNQLVTNYNGMVTGLESDIKNYEQFVYN